MFEGLEVIVSLDSSRMFRILTIISLPFLLLELSVNRNGWEIFLSQDLIQLNSILNLSHKDNDLIEHERVQEVSESSDLLVVLQLHVVLLKSVKSKFALVVNENLELILHESSTDVFDLTSHGG